MKKISLIIFIFVHIGLLAQTNWYVDYQNGDDSNSGTSVSEAVQTIDALTLQPGDIVFIIGQYNNSKYDPNFTYGGADDRNNPQIWHAQNTIKLNGINGTSSAYITLKPYDENTVLKGDGANILRITNCSYIRIEGLEIYGEVEHIPLSTAEGLETEGLQFLYLDNDNTVNTRKPTLDEVLYRVNVGTTTDEIENTTYPELGSVTRPSYTDTRGIYISGSHHIEIINNLIHHMPGGGLRVAECSNVKIIGNEIHNCSRRSYSGTHALVVTKTYPGTTESGDDPTYSIIIEKNKIHHNYNEVFSWAPTKTIITPRLDEGKGISLQRNNLTEWIDGSKKILVKNNIAYWNGFSGIHSNDGWHIDFINNTNYMNSYTNTVTYANETQQGNNIGMSCSNGDDIKFINNIAVIDTDWGGFAISATSDINTLVVQNNLIYGYGGATVDKDADVTAIEQNTIEANPLFTDVNTFDFHPTLASPVIDAGADNSNITDDFDGDPRNDGDIDIGAYEFTSVSSITVQGQGGATSIDGLGNTLQMEASVLPENADIQTVTWSVDDTGIATIDANGVLTSVATGTVRVTATANDNSGVSGYADITITDNTSGGLDISFDNNTWTYTSGITQNGNSISITGSETSTEKAYLDVNIPSGTKELYFIAEIELINVIPGANPSNDLPKMKVLQTDNTRIAAYNLEDYPEGKSYQTGLMIAKFDKLNLSEIRVQFAIQKASGTMIVKNPLLLTSAPPIDYQFPFTVPADPSVTLDIDTAEHHTFQNDLLSTNSHFSWATYSWGDQIVVDAINNWFPMSNMRFPGGTVGNFYDWSFDSFYDNEYSKQTYIDKRNAGWKFGYPGYKDLCLANDATATLMFNVITDEVATAKNRLQSRINDGINIKWIEMGNENFFKDQAMGNVDDNNKDGNYFDDYISHTNSLAAGLKQIDPNIRVAINVEKDNYTTGDWNDNLSQQNYYDAAVFHNYVKTKTFMYNELAVYKMMSAYKKTMERLNKFDNTFNVPALITEWNVLSEGAPVNFTQALSVGDLFFALEKGNHLGIVEQAGIHMLYKNDAYTESTLMYYDGNKMVLTAIGVVYATLFEVFKNNKVYDAYSSSAELRTGLPAVNAKAVDAGDSIKIYVVNKLPVSAPLIFKYKGRQYSGFYNMKYYTENINSELTNPYDTPNQPFTHTSGSRQIDIPPYSITVVSIDKDDLFTTRWTGAQSNLWSDPANWDNGVPDNYVKAIVKSSTNQPVVDINAEAYKLAIRAGSTLTINPGKSLIVDKLTNISGTLYLKSDATGQGTFINNSSIQYGTDGNAIVELYLTGNQYHYVSSPMANADVNIFKSDPVQPNYNHNFYYYDETDENADYAATAWKEKNGTMNVAEGYAVWYDRTPTILFDRTTCGDLNTGNQSISLSYTGSSAAPVEHRGWNLVGNPFPAPIDWDNPNWTKDNIYNSIYFWNGTNYSYYVSSGADLSEGTGVNDGTNIIPPLQGFFVKVQEGNPDTDNQTGQLTIPEDARVISNQSFWKQKSSKEIRLSVTGNGYSDETLVRFIEGATDAFDDHFDAFKLFSDVEGVPQIYTIQTDKINCAINSMSNAYDFEKLIIPVGFKTNKAGEYIINANDIDISTWTQVSFKDKYTGEVLDMQDLNYTFTSEAGTFNDRFIIKVLNKSTTDIEKLNNTNSNSEEINIYQQNNVLILKSKTPEHITGAIKIFNIKGEQVFNIYNKQAGTVQFTLNLKPGVYILHIAKSKKYFSKKFIIK